MQEFGVNTAPFFLAKPDQFTTSQTIPLSFPLFIKPIYEGGGMGIDSKSVINNFKSYDEKVNDIFNKFKTSALVEKFLNGREFTVGIIGNDHENLVAMPIEIIAVSNEAGEKVRGSKVKKADTEKPIYIQDDEIRKNVSELAKTAFKVLGARDYGRIDIRMGKEGIPYFLEANLMPGLSRNYGDLSRSCTINKVMTYEEMILKIVELGLTRALK
jgi:D-alanine-D-alanine ligase